MAELQILIKNNGEVETSMLGVKGNGCETITKKIEQALGNITKSERTSEYFENSNVGITPTVS